MSLRLPPRVKFPEVLTEPVSVIPLTVPVPPTDVTVPVVVLKFASLFNALNFISLAAFLDSVAPLRSINSVPDVMSAVMSVKVEKSRETVPLVTSIPVPSVINA